MPFVAGGGPGGIARALAPGLSERLKKSVIVENRPGAGGILGTTAVAKAAPDGLTLVLGSTSSFAAAPVMNKSNVRYDAVRDFVHIGMIGRVPVVLISKTDGPFGSLAHLLAAASQKPGELTFGFPGNGSAPHLLCVMFSDVASIEVTSVPFRGGPDSLTALIAGNISFAGKSYEATALGEADYIVYDRDITENAVRWLREHAEPRGKPWVLLVSFSCPHPPFVVPKRLADLYDPAQVPLPPCSAPGSSRSIPPSGIPGTSIPARVWQPRISCGRRWPVTSH